MLRCLGSTVCPRWVTLGLTCWTTQKTRCALCDMCSWACTLQCGCGILCDMCSCACMLQCGYMWDFVWYVFMCMYASVWVWVVCVIWVHVHVCFNVGVGVCVHECVCGEVGGKREVWFCGLVKKWWRWMWMSHQFLLVCKLNYCNTKIVFI